MCQMYFKRADALMERELWDSINKFNPDGISIWNFDTKELHKFLNSERAWEYVQDNPQAEMFIHHRLGTSGAVSLDQLHGFDIGHDCILFHNGVLSSFRGTDTLSDTQQFVQEVKDLSWGIDDITYFLITQERTSRFVIIDKNTNNILIPNCAPWYRGEYNKQEWTFSNDYAFRGLYPNLYKIGGEVYA